MQTGLDHIILGAADLAGAVAWLEQRSGVRAALGGIHPGRGTQNALLALGPRSYLEIIAPDPAQAAPTWFSAILTMSIPRLIGWAAHTSDLNALAQTAHSAGIAIEGPQDGARSRPDGKTLTWKSFRLREDFGGLLPFFIEWGRGTVHPAADAPPGCQLAGWRLHSPNAGALETICQTLAVEIAVESSEEPRLLARIMSPVKEFELAS